MVRYQLEAANDFRMARAMSPVGHEAAEPGCPLHGHDRGLNRTRRGRRNPVENDQERTCDHRHLNFKYAFGRSFVLAEVGSLPRCHSGRHVLRKYDRRSAARLSLIPGERFFHAAIVVEMDV